MRFKSLFFFFMAALFLVSCQKETNPDAAGRPEFAYNTKAAQLLDMVNKIRQSGCKCDTENMTPVGPLAWNDLLGKAAFLHSEDMNKRNYFDHKSPEGETFVDRAKSVGYNSFTALGENIARGQSTEQEVFNSWIKSKAHCKAIMNGQFKEMGLGRSGNCWTQTFGASK